MYFIIHKKPNNTLMNLNDTLINLMRLYKF